jgi:formyltetrahydrofolate deformylase
MSCPDTTGIVAAITQFIAAHGGLITETAHYVDGYVNRSFMRTCFQGDVLPAREAIEAEFAAVAARFGMDWELHDADRRCRVLVAVSREGHCLNALLHRWSIGVLPIDLVGVVSNHDAEQRLVEWYGVPFHHFPIEPGRKAEQEGRLLALFDESRADLLVLARYMQILSDAACARLRGRCINIHHSFLPGFKGARPYHQAHERGVKIIGATAHYVTEELDAGPIIEQDVVRVSHRAGVDELTRMGADIERLVLARAVRWHLEDRVLVDEGRTIVFV